MKDENDDILIGAFVTDPETESFFERNREYLALVCDIKPLAYSIFDQIKVKRRVDFFVLMLARSCVRQFDAIYLLTKHSHGYPAMRLIRSMFEYYVDAHYLKLNSAEAADFLCFYLIQKEIYHANKNRLKRREINKIYRRLSEEFPPFFRMRNGEPYLFRTSWSTLSLPQRAKRIGLDTKSIQAFYKYPSLLAHSSMIEIGSGLDVATDEMLKVSLSSSPHESIQEPDIALRCAVGLMMAVLGFLTTTYDIAYKEDYFDLVDRILNYDSA